MCKRFLWQLYQWRFYTQIKEKTINGYINLTKKEEDCQQINMSSFLTVTLTADCHLHIVTTDRHLNRVNTNRHPHKLTIDWHPYIVTTDRHLHMETTDCHLHQICLSNNCFICLWVHSENQNISCSVLSKNMILENCTTAVSTQLFYGLHTIAE